MPAGLYDKYKPTRISQTLWEKWMIDMFYDSSNYDPTIFNRWWYGRVKSEALEKVLVEEERVPMRRMGRKTRVGGIQPFGHPDYVSSIGDYGGLHFGTEFGWQRKVKDAPRGRAYGFAGNFILMLSMGREWFEIERTFNAGGSSYHNWGYKDMLAAGWSLLEEAEKRGDFVTILHSPRNWEHDYDKFWQGGMGDREMGDNMRIQWYKRDGKPMKLTSSSESEYGGKVVEGGNALLINPSKELWNYGIAHDYEMQLQNIARGRFDSGAELSPPMFEHSRDYDAIKRFWLGMPNFGSGDYTESKWTATDPMYLWFYLRKLSGAMSKSARTNIIWIGTSKYPQLVNTGWRYLEELQSKINLWFLDVGDRNQESEYFGDKAIMNHATRKIGGQETDIPLMVGKGGKRLFNYVYVDDISQLTKAVLEVAKKIGSVP